MTHPPEDRRPDQPGDEGGPENEPTVAWTPPEPEREPEPPAEEGGPGYAAMPDEMATPHDEPPPAPPAPNMPTEPAEPAEPASRTEPPAQPSGPIISATPAEPAQPASGWQTQAQPTPTPPAPGTGWDVPAPAAAAAPTQMGDVIAGPGARVVAWLIDYTLAGIIPAAIGLALIDWGTLFRRVFEAAAQDPTGRSIDPNSFAIPTTLDLVLANLIATGVLYLYFVGFWTSRWRATPGMIGLKMRVVDARTGGELSLLQATKRWLAFGYWLPLLGLLPGLQSSAGLIQTGLWIFLFFTTVTNERRQGLQDRWSDAMVIRSSTSGSGATFAGCLVWGVLVIILAFVASAIFFAAAAPSIQEYLDSLPSQAL